MVPVLRPRYSLSMACAQSSMSARPWSAATRCSSSMAHGPPGEVHRQDRPGALGDRHTTVRRRYLEIGAGSSAHILKLAISQVAEDGVGLFVFPVRELSDVVQHIAARHEQVLPPVVIKIENPISPSGHSSRPKPDALQRSSRRTGRRPCSEKRETIRSPRRCARCPGGHRCPHP